MSPPQSPILPFSCCSWGSQGKNAAVVCHSLLQWTMFCHSPPWPVHLRWPYMAWFIVALSKTRLWSTWPVQLVFCDCDFHSVCPLMDEDKRLMEASWWEGLAVGKTRSCSGQGNAQKIFNPIFCWWGNGGKGDFLQKHLCQHTATPKTVVVHTLDPTAGHCQPTSLLETPRHSQASLAQSLVRTLVLCLGFWCAQWIVCSLKESASLEVLSPFAKSPGWEICCGPYNFTTVCELFWCNCSPVYGSSAQQLYSGTNGNHLQEDFCHMQYLPGLLKTKPPSLQQVISVLCLCRRHSNTQRQVWLSLL